jgi:tetratricopeptide (TPR) repeat protein
MPTLLDALDKAAPSISVRLAGQPQLEGQVRLALGKVYLSLEKLDAARQQLVPAEALLRPHADVAHAEALMQLATLDWWDGHYADAERRMQRVIAALGSAAPVDALVSALNTYAALLNDLGRFDAAIGTIQRTQRLIDQGAAISPRDHADLLGNLGFARHGLGQLDAAIKAHTAALLEYRHALPPLHPAIAISLNNLAMALQDAGRRDEALSAFRSSLAIRRKFAGADQSMTVKAESNLAVFLAESGRHDEARSLMAEALGKAPKAYGPDRVALAHTHSAAARVAMAAGDAATAITQSEAALALYASAEIVDPGYPARARATLEQANKRMAGGQ